MQPLFIATWNFGLAACKQSLATWETKRSVLDSVEQGIRVTEADPNVDSVGIGGAPNAAGVVQLDACIMDGMTQRAGSVAGLEGFLHPISIARRVMEKTKHVMLVGNGAAEFARSEGFETQDLLTPNAKKKWQEWQRAAAEKQRKPQGHDTIALLGLAPGGHLAGGCSTSGLAYKLPGRVGDSPILGGGLYVDGEVGAAGATGIGENIMRYCGSFLTVEHMRAGMDPTAACRATIERIIRLDRRPAAELRVNLIAIDKQGRWGAAGTDEDFSYAVVTPTQAQVEKPLWVR
jgi:L-asparaginase/N4-(beta-N-acetylglucosaminyl)-L-asparaginase